ncbi:MAG: hypothetical protein A3I61_08190 [Acidobacteria bacterium RIFCSPLOWO2_02_FULL_68_18]|nr:MAG: hypothetical protein A3I61_08190 [Acidobacteria bacterium RIFCSPLOWO2_02_FULL_68_18]OFW51219.1 MAG: hypothetical protein A3G77_06285 [Acidobacteria bacterium RIFCSPLOWO2_12_FULL_68_19]
MAKTLGVVVGGLVLICGAQVATAHHSFAAEYDATKKVKLEGVIKQVAWTNPHMRVYIDVTDASGKVTTWNMELTSPNSVQRQGWTRSSLVPGDRVVFEGYGGKTVDTRGALARIAKVESPDKPLFIQGGPEANALVEQQQQQQ